MLVITIPGGESFNDETNEFITTQEIRLELEHSLVSLSKWESTWEKAFLGPEPKTTAETLGYVVAMTLNQDVPLEAYSRLTNENLNQVNAYIAAKMTATSIKEDPRRKPSREVVTSEVLYSLMIALNIPFECEEWHLNRLLTLLRVCEQKNTPPKKMTPGEIAAQNRELNAQRKRAHQTTG